MKSYQKTERRKAVPNFILSMEWKKAKNFWEILLILWKSKGCCVLEEKLKWSWEKKKEKTQATTKSNCSIIKLKTPEGMQTVFFFPFEICFYFVRMKSITVYSKDVTEKPEWTFWPTQYNVLSAIMEVNNNKNKTSISVWGETITEELMF